MKDADKINIRKAVAEDAGLIVLLAKELGYDASLKEIETRITKINSSKTEEIYIAEYDKVVGWMHISVVEPLESAAFIEIRGIVVNKEHRRKGIGTLLIKTAENHAREAGIKKVRIRTNIKREETRTYYRHLNYIPIKTQEVFEKKI